MDVLALITARGGSKSIPKKNITILAGKPLIAWTIEAALESSSINRVVVSTDDNEIAKISTLWGADVPFMRPSELAQDDSPHIDVIIHAIDWLAEHQNYYPDYVMLLQPTSPFRTSEDIEHAIGVGLEQDADIVVSVCMAGTHPYLAKRISNDGTLEDFVPKPDGYLLRQNLPPVYKLNGAIYMAKRKVMLDENSWYLSEKHAYKMPTERSIDIDTPWDLYLANLILQNRTSNKEVK